jgi:hypothetical protein
MDTLQTSPAALLTVVFVVSVTLAACVAYVFIVGKLRRRHHESGRSSVWSNRSRMARMRLVVQVAVTRVVGSMPGSTGQGIGEPAPGGRGGSAGASPSSAAAAAKVAAALPEVNWESD